MKSKKSLILMILAAGLLSCDKKNQVCGGTDPANDLPWLKKEIESLEKSKFCTSISRTTYKENAVFVFTNCDPNINSIPLLYDCNGIRLELSATDYQQLKFNGPIEQIWKSK